MVRKKFSSREDCLLYAEIGSDLIDIFIYTPKNGMNIMIRIDWASKDGIDKNIIGNVVI